MYKIQTILEQPEIRAKDLLYEVGRAVNIEQRKCFDNQQSLRGISWVSIIKDMGKWKKRRDRLKGKSGKHGAHGKYDKVLMDTGNLSYYSWNEGKASSVEATADQVMSGSSAPYAGFLNKRFEFAIITEPLLVRIARVAKMHIERNYGK